MHEESQAHGKDNPIRDPALVSGLHSAIERKQKERVVRETERFYEQLVGEAGDAIVVLDRAGTILTWNTGAERMFGWTTEEAIGRSYLTLQGDDVRPHVTENLRRLFAGARLINHEIRRRRKDGTWFDALLTATPVRNAQGQVTAAQSIIKDITERKQAEEALQESERHLREFYRTRDEDEHLIPISLNQIARHAISLTQPRWKDQALAAGITVRIATDLQTVPLVVANESEIREALLNLIFNAVDAMPQGGTITIRTRSGDGCAELEVSDTGTGMTEEARRRCLEPFFSTKGEHGTGLGLAMVYGIIERHHGRIAIDSEPGRGTTVTLRLPVEAEPEVKDKTQEAVAPSRRLRILVVDDEPLMCEVLTEYLTRDGHTVETAANGREGLEKFHGGWFDVVITDRGMPEMSGDQMAASIKRTAPTKPVILLTGFGDLILAAGEKPGGIDSVISKPVTAAALRKALADIIP